MLFNSMGEGGIEVSWKTFMRLAYFSARRLTARITRICKHHDKWEICGYLIGHRHGNIAHQVVAATKPRNNREGPAIDSKLY